MTTDLLNQAANEPQTAYDGADAGSGSLGAGPGMARFPHIRHPWIAVLMSQLMLGLGQVYCGQIGKGLLIMFVNTMLILLSLGALARYATTGTARLLVATLLPLFLLWLVATMDAFMTARRTRLDYRLKDYNRQSVYTLLLLLSSLSCVAYSFDVKDRFLQAFHIPSTSCYPSFVPKDRILVNKMAYDKQEPRRGDVIVFHRPDNREMAALKRIVALAGDTVEVREGRLYVNGSKCDRLNMGASAVLSGKEKAAAHIWIERNGTAGYPILVADQQVSKANDFPPLKVPAYHCFVMSDDRNLTPDSRQFGPIQITSIIGRADYIYWPADSWSRFGRLARDHTVPTMQAR